MLTLQEPVTAKESGNYLAVIEDADGVVHFWKKDGSYDGHDMGCDCGTNEEVTTDHRETVL